MRRFVVPRHIFFAVLHEFGNRGRNVISQGTSVNHCYKRNNYDDWNIRKIFLTYKKSLSNNDVLTVIIIIIIIQVSTNEDKSNISTSLRSIRKYEAFVFNYN